MSVEAVPAPSPPPIPPIPPILPIPPPRRVDVLATLGDSTPTGLGDPVPGGSWRGFPVHLGAALGAPELVNTARTGARMAHVRHEQLPAMLAAAPDVAVVCAGMNDTLRADFDPVALHADCAATVGALRAAGAHVLLLRYHDHSRIFRLPAPLARALRCRIAALNAATDAAAALAGADVLDLALLPGAYETTSWSMDRLHPSERGHRLLAEGFCGLLARAGFAVPHPVSLACAGGRVLGPADRMLWLTAKGVPWLVRRGRDLGPVILQGLAAELRTRRPPTPERPDGTFAR